MGRIRVNGRWTIALLAMFGWGCEGVLGGSNSLDPDDSAKGQSGNGDGDVAMTHPSEPLHRLNRLEYDNTVHELLGIDLSPASAFPPDPALGGFDNMAEGLSLSPSLFDLYFSAASELVLAAFATGPAFEQRADLAEGAPGGFLVGTDVWALHGSTWQYGFTPQPGEMRLSVVLSGTRTGAAPVPEFELSVNGTIVSSGAIEQGPADPHLLEVVVESDGGPLEVVVRPTNFINIGVQNTNNEVILHSVSLASVAQKEPTAAPLLPCDLLTADCPQSALLHLAERAYRRPLESDERTRLENLFAELSKDEGPLAAFQLAMRAVLTSPQFLYRGVRRQDVDDEGRLSSHALASRLSYFLFSSMPDEELFAAASEGRLETDEDIALQVTRMLASEKSQSLVDGFAEQWLGVRQLRGATPSAETYPGFDDELRGDMAEESRAFFAAFLHDDVPLDDLTSPSFGFLSDRLAAHYQLPPPGQAEVTQVTLGGDQRRGLLELGAWLTAQSDAEMSSPIRRGRWVLEQFLCTPIPPPPPTVIAELPDVEGLSTREKLALHRDDPSCATCHKLLDPVGLGFEVYDGVAKPVPPDVEVDASGELPDGTPFDGPRELSQALSGDARVGHCFTEKLLVYALGRQLTSKEDALVTQIHEAAGGEEAAGGGAASISRLISAIATSEAFRAVPDEWAREETP